MGNRMIQSQSLLKSNGPIADPNLAIYRITFWVNWYLSNHNIFYKPLNLFYPQICIKTLKIERLSDTTYVQESYHRLVYKNIGKKSTKTNQRVYSYEGNEPGISVSLYFELRNGIWYLIKKEAISK